MNTLEGIGGEFHEAPEIGEDGLTAQERLMAEEHLSRYSGVEKSEAERRDCEKEVAEFQVMLEDFEARHSLDELNAIIDLRPEDIEKYPLRQSAKKALIPIVTLMNALEEQTNISHERFDELKARYQRLHKAVGMINNNKVRH